MENVHRVWCVRTKCCREIKIADFGTSKRLAGLQLCTEDSVGKNAFFSIDKKGQFAMPRYSTIYESGCGSGATDGLWT